MLNRTFSRTILFCCFLSLVSLSTPLAAGSVLQVGRCSVVQLNQDYPPNANAGDTIQVTTTMDIACAQWRTYYTGRIDLVDLATKAILSSSPFNIGWIPYVTATVANTATVPQLNGPWKLDLIVYIFEDGSLLNSVDRLFTIQIGAVNAFTTQATSTVKTTLSATSSQPAVTSQTSTTEPPVTSPLILEPVPVALAALIVGLCAVLVALVLRARKRNA